MVEFYCDGSYMINRSEGGWAVVVVKDGKYISHFAEQIKNSTSNRAEMFGFIKALELSAKEKEVIIYTDSKYIVNGYKNWAAEWKRRGWKNSKGKPTKNADLWRKIFSLKKDHISVYWIKGHAGDEFNELADSLAKF